MVGSSNDESDSDGDALAVNRGTVSTAGDAVLVSGSSLRTAVGVGSWTDRGDAQTLNYGTVTTSGTGARGLFSWAESTGSTQIRNYGTVTTSGGRASIGGRTRSADGVVAGTAESGNALVVNERTGTVTTSGAGARGLVAITETTGSAEVRNHGTVTTTGALATTGSLEATEENPRSAYGMTASSAGSGNALAVNERTGTVATRGADADAVFAWSAQGNAEAVNRGTVTTQGSGAPGARVAGVAAMAEQGNARIILDGGTINVAGSNNIGLYASTPDNGTNTITVDISGGALVTAETAARFVGGRATVKAMGAETRRNILRGAVHFGNRNDRLRLRYSEIHGDINFGRGRDRLTLNAGAVIRGDIDFGEDSGGYITLTPEQSALLPAGCAVDLDAPSRGDVLCITVSERNAPTVHIHGEVRNANRFCKGGKGAAFLHQGISFKGSQASIEDGLLILGDHMNLGASGTLTVKDRAALRFRIGENDQDYGRVTAGTVTFEDDDSDTDTTATPNLQVSKKSGASVSETSLTGLEFINAGSILGKPQGGSAAPLSGSLSITNAQGGVVGTSTVSDAGGSRKKLSFTNVEDVNRILVTQNDPDPGTRTPVAPDPGDSGNDGTNTPDDPGGGGGSSGGGSGGGGIAALGSVALILAMINRSPEADDPMSEDEETATELSVTAVDSKQYDRVRQGGMEFWTRSFQDDLPTARATGVRANATGWSLGINTRPNKGFQAGISATPEVSITALGKAPDSRQNALFSGSGHAIHGGYRGGVFFARATRTEGSYDAYNSLSDPLSGGTVAGLVKVRNRQSALTMGLVQDIHRMRVKPKVMWFSGQLDGSQYQAANSLMRAAAPATTHSYRGWGGGLSVASRGWLPTGSDWRWRPQMQWTAHRLYTTDFVSEGQLRYADRAGITSFTMPAKAADMPRSVIGMTATVDAARSRAPDSWRVKMGFGGAVVDDESWYAVVFGAQKRF